MQMEKNLNSPARLRLTALFDEGSYKEIGSCVMEKDAPAGVVCAYGFIGGNPAYAFAQDQSNACGAVGNAQAEKIARVYDLASRTGDPVVGIFDSNGAFMDGSAASLNAYSLIMNKVSAVSGVVPQIAVIAGPCAGSAAMIACACDYVVMAENAELFLTPSFEKGAGTAKAAAENGIAALTAKDDMEAVAKAKALLAMLPVNNMASVPCTEYAMPAAAAGKTLQSVVDGIADGGSVVELYADYAGAAYTALATIEGSTVAIAATNKTEDKLTVADCAKLAHFVRTCDAFSIPVITLVDTLGFAGSSDTEVSGDVKALTRLAGSYAEATTPKVTVITGKAVGPVFVAMAGKYSNADFTYAVEGACISPLAPEAAVEFLWHDKLAGAENLSAKRAELAKEYAATLASAEAAAQQGCVDEVVAAADLRSVLTGALTMLADKRVTNLPRKHNNFPF